MKRILFILISVFMLSVADNVSAKPQIRPTQLPRVTQTFLKHNWPGISVSSAARNAKNYTVYMEDGTRLVFSLKGEWQEITNEYGIPTAYLPSNIHQYVSDTYETSLITGVKKMPKGYLVTITGDLRLRFSYSGAYIRLD